MSSRTFIAVVANKPSYNGAILLFNMRLVVLLVRSGSGECDLFGFAVIEQSIVYELASIVSVEPKHWKRKDFPDLYQRTANFLFSTPNQCQAFCPAAVDVGQSKRVQECSMNAVSAMGYKIAFQKSRHNIVPI